MITKFNQFVNENIKDLLKPKSDEIIKKELDNLSDYKRYKMVISNNLPKKFLPKLRRLHEENKLRQKIIDKIQKEVEEVGGMIHGETDIYNEEWYEEGDNYDYVNITLDEEDKFYCKVDTIEKDKVKVQIVKKNGTTGGSYDIILKNAPLETLMKIIIGIDRHKEVMAYDYDEDGNNGEDEEEWDYEDEDEGDYDYEDEDEEEWDYEDEDEEEWDYEDEEDGEWGLEGMDL